MLLFLKIDLPPIGRRSRAHSTVSPCQDIIKRGFDIVVAIAGLLLLSPLTLLISLAIKSASPGPIVCRHKRYGVYNETFELFEFRTTLAREGEESFTLAADIVRPHAFHRTRTSARKAKQRFLQKHAHRHRTGRQSKGGLRVALLVSGISSGMTPDSSAARSPPLGHLPTTSSVSARRAS
jgi:hypothetical protein